MNRRGVAAVLILLGCGLGGFYTGGREFFLLAVVLACLLLLALLQALLQKPQLRLDPSPAPQERGHEQTAYIEVSNPSPLPLLPINLRLLLTREGTPPQLLWEQNLALRGHEKQRLEARPLCPHCGEYQLALARYCRQDIFGFFRLPGAEQPPISLFALPRLSTQPLDSLSGEQPQSDESLLERQREQGQLAAEARTYRQGDAMRAIHWKKSAARHELFTRLRAEESGNDYTLLIDHSCELDGEEKLVYLDALYECGLNFIYNLLANGQAITLLPGGRLLSHPAQLGTAAQLMAAGTAQSDAIPTALQSLLDRRELPNVLFLLLSRPSPHLRQGLARLAEQGCELVYLCPAAYADMAQAGLPFIFLPEVDCR